MRFFPTRTPTRELRVKPPMADGDKSEEPMLAAGDFSSWIGGMQDAMRGERASEVPCGGCTACCTSSQFVHIGPDETDTLARIPTELLFPAPRLPPGHVVLGYDERGHCPMLTENRCTIYEHRPQACRTYDCRIFAAAGIEVDDDEKVLLALQARRWQFSFPTEADRTQHRAVGTAAAFLHEHADLLPDAVAPRNATQLAVLAIDVHAAFLRCDEETGQSTVVEPDPDMVRAEVVRSRGLGRREAT